MSGVQIATMEKYMVSLSNFKNELAERKGEREINY